MKLIARFWLKNGTISIEVFTFYPFYRFPTVLYLLQQLLTHDLQFQQPMVLATKTIIRLDQRHLSWDGRVHLDLRVRNMNQLKHCLRWFDEILQLLKHLQEFLRFHGQDQDGPKLKFIVYLNNFISSNIVWRNMLWAIQNCYLYSCVNFQYTQFFI